MAELVAVADD